MTIKANNILSTLEGVNKETPWNNRARECRYACKKCKQAETRNAQ